MIQANELRKNNKVLLEGMLLTVKEIKEHEATFFETPAAVEYPDIDPIPLTPEILEACGFKKTTEGGDNFCDEYLNNPVHIFFDSEDFWFGFDAGPKLRRNFAIASVHQLQNLFFALTGTELTINLEKVKV